MNWLQISLQVEPEVAEAVADVLSRYAPGGVACQQDALDMPDANACPDGPLQPLVTVYAYLPMTSDVEAKRRQVEEAVWHLQQISPSTIPAPTFEEIAEAQWAEAWKDHFHVTRIGGFVIKPSWRAYAPQPGDHIIELDPGQAFGTGLHPTTQMCLAAVESYVRPGQRVLDLGSGSGILAIAAARLGASQVLALDIDPVAVEVACANVAANGVSQVVTALPGTLAEARRQLPFDLALVNILAKVIVELCQQGLAQVLAPGGTLALAGLIDTQEDEVRQALAGAGLEVVQRMQDKDWVGLVCRC